ncbi:hypothetical protein [Streptomyces chartreusis]|uniref:hypothetical protein n=1 Tax=Streptomyces chartreusis TaxID=1969 RepID=UPI0036325696
MTYDLEHGWPWLSPELLVELGMVGAAARALIVAEYRMTGLSPMAIAETIAEVGPL